MTNQRTRFIFDEQPIRGIHVQLTDVWQHIAQQKPYPKAIRRAPRRTAGRRRDSIQQFETGRPRSSCKCKGKAA